MTLMYQIRNRIPIKQCIVFHHIYFYCHVFDLPASCIHFNKRNHTVNMTRKLRKLTKKEIVNLSNRAMDYYRKFPKDVTKTLERAVSNENHILDSPHRMVICKLLAGSSDLTMKFAEKYSELFVSSFKGRHADRMSNLAIGWIIYVSQYMEPGKQQHIWLNSILKKSKKLFSSSDISATIHAFANQFSNHISMYISQLQSPFSLPKDICRKDPISSLLAFGGACLRLMYIKARQNKNTEMCSYIDNLRLTERQRRQLKEKKVIRSTNLKSLHSIPVPALVPYLIYVNESLQAMCTKRSLSQLKSSFIKVKEGSLFTGWGRQLT